jgi:hypothetical protein
MVVHLIQQKQLENVLGMSASSSRGGDEAAPFPEHEKDQEWARGPGQRA